MDVPIVKQARLLEDAPEAVAMQEVVDAHAPRRIEVVLYGNDRDLSARKSKLRSMSYSLPSVSTER